MFGLKHYGPQYTGSGTTHTLRCDTTGHPPGAHAWYNFYFFSSSFFRGDVGQVLQVVKGLQLRYCTIVSTSTIVLYELNMLCYVLCPNFIY